MKNTKIGDCFLIPLPDDYFSLGLIVSEYSEMQFFNYFSKEKSVPDDIWVLTKIFRVKVSLKHISKSNWIYLDNVDVPDSERAAGKYVVGSIGSDETTCLQGNIETQIAKKDCAGIELFAQWLPGHLLERLDSFRKGEVSKFHRAMRENAGMPL
jgi:hypothetical protein